MYEHESAFHRLRVTDNNGIRLLAFERNQQSSMRLDDPFETDIDYIGYLHLALAVCPDATRTLVIGLGGGSVVKRMWRDYEAMRIDAIEIDPEVADIAREFFEVAEDERLRVTIADGRQFLSESSETYDIIIVDAFSDDRIPRPLTTEEFLRECHTHLSEGGVVAYNIIGAVYGPHSKPFRSLYRTAANVWRHLWAFPVGITKDVRDDTRNIVLLASDAELTEERLLELIANRVDGRVTVPGFERFGDDLYRGTVRTGDVGLLADERSARQRRR